MFAGRTLGFCAALALAHLVRADETALSAPALAAAEATLDFCAQADPKSADRYWQQAELLLGGVPEKMAAEIRKSDEYRRAYVSASQMIGKVAKQDALRACADSLAAKP
jgi:hypothetical protein